MDTDPTQGWYPSQGIHEVKPHPFAKGQRVRMSAVGIAELAPRKPDCVGTVWRKTRDPRVVSVKWDDVKTESYYAVRFIEPAV